MRQVAAIRRRSAFTLIELLIVIILLGTLAAIVEPQMAY
ncbi:MAG: prepilin-type N-terminal cleavage/methylation domain-containing protein [Phycisphaerae bacterium]|jgi:prepilin-type N-terminal cleavage/methylation domain-containing protein|nr:prepilin-type N-terminal cleavage/methylation domain-containing protein [Phycisphaerae bacterium]